MKILAVSGSARRLSTNTALLRALQAIAPDGIAVQVYDGIGDLPVFSPDREGADLPDDVRNFQQAIADCDGLLLSSPEYVRSIPGGLKNAIDWLVSGDQVVDKPIALVHASHRGDDMLAALRMVLSTISANFTDSLFFRLPVMKETPEAILQRLVGDPDAAQRFLRDFARFCRDGANERLPQHPIS